MVEASALVDDLVGVNGGLDYTLGKVLLNTLSDRNHSLTVDDWLNLCEKRVRICKGRKSRKAKNEIEF